jgi:hypothetical protein
LEIAYSTEHATSRLRQRGIPAELLDLLVRYGVSWHDGRGARVLAFDKKSRKRLRRELGSKLFARWESRLNVYAVVSPDEVLITVGHRLHRSRRHH